MGTHLSGLEEIEALLCDMKLNLHVPNRSPLNLYIYSNINKFEHWHTMPFM